MGNLVAVGWEPRVAYHTELLVFGGGDAVCRMCKGGGFAVNGMIATVS